MPGAEVDKTVVRVDFVIAWSWQIRLTVGIRSTGSCGNLNRCEKQRTELKK